MEYLKVWVSFREDISMLNDAEKGRLFDAMLLYAASGEESDLKGNERFVWPGAKQAIDRTAQKIEVLRRNGSKGGRPRKKPNESKNNQTEPNESKNNQTEPNESRKEKKVVAVVVDKEEDNEGYLFGLTDEEIHAAMETERQIEDCARYVGLETTLAALDEAKELARQYGLESLLAAMRQAVDVHTWRYVKGILRKGGVGKKDQEETAPSENGQAYTDENGEEIRWIG